MKIMSKPATIRLCKYATFIWLIFLNFNSFAQQAQTTPKAINDKSITSKSSSLPPAKRPATVQTYLSKPFQASTINESHLSPSFKGHDAVKIFTGLEKLNLLEQGEFESSDDFEIRRNKLASSEYLKNFTVSNQLAFVMKVHKSDHISRSLYYQYNANSEEVRIFLWPSLSTPNNLGNPASGLNDYPNSVNRPSVYTLSIDKHWLSKNQYIGSNAFGASTVVTESNYKEYLMGFDKEDFDQFRSKHASFGEPFATFKLNNATASTMLPGLSAVFIAKPIEPYVYYDFSHEKPTLSSPKEAGIYRRIIKLKIDEVVFYSKINGNVVYRAGQY